MDLNPITVREARVRWRGGRAFWLALAYAGFLSAVLWFNYSGSQGRWAGSEMDDVGAAAKLGHEMFGLLCFVQVFAWLLMSPILTASALAGEREKGLLEGLLLSRLSPKAIVRGKMASALSMIVLLVLAGLPVSAMCFLMGGVSPGEFVGSLALQLATAVCGASIGLLASATQRRTIGAAGAAIAWSLLWMIVTGIAAGFFSATYRSTTPAGGAEMSGFIASANPLSAVILLTDSSLSGNALGSDLTQAIILSNFGWLVSVASMGLISAWCLRKASAVLSRSPEKFDHVPAANYASGTSASTYASANMAPLAWDASEEALSSHALEYARRREEERQRALAAEESSHWDVPILKHIVFGNALMRRELAVAWRKATLSPNGQAAVVVGILLAGWLSLMGLASVLSGDDGDSEVAWWVVFSAYSFLGVVFCAARPALSIARERENGAWQALRLTPLTPLQIAQAKIGAPLVAAVGYGAVAWMFLLMAALRGHIVPMAAPMSLMMLIIWAQVAAWSAFCGASVRTSATGLACGIGGPIVAWAGLPLLAALFDVSLRGSGLDKLILLLNPFAALTAITERGSYLLPAFVMQAGIAALLFQMALGAVKRSQQAEKIGASHSS